MKSVMICLLTIGLCLPSLARDKSAEGRDCVTQHSNSSSTVFFFKTCTGSQLEPDVRLTVHRKDTSKRCTDKDGRETLRVHTQIHGTGVGIKDGNEYVINAQGRDLIIESPGCGFSITDIFDLILVSKGPAPNEQVRVKVTRTFDSNCQETTTREMKVICQD